MEPPQVLAADWVIPVASPPIPDGAVALEGGRIAWVGRRPDLPSRFLGASFRAFPQSLLLPGWVNAHSHLNLTGAMGLIRGSADRFPNWIRAVLDFQRRLTPELVHRSVRAGLDLLAYTGTTAVAHTSSFPEVEPFLDHPLRSVVFHEALGFPAAGAAEALREAEEWLDSAEAVIADAGATHVRPGLAAHAPYSTSPQLIRGIALLARRRGVPFSIHLAETREEAAFLRSGAGPFRHLLEELGRWEPGWSPPGTGPIEYAAALGLLGPEGPAGCAVHCNYLEPGDAERIRAGRLVPTWCPGSHLFFGHEPHPAAELIAAGIPVAVGTDSPASNAGLTMLREVRLAAAACPGTDPWEWVRAGTLTAARALGLEATCGSLEPGRSADLQVLEGVTEEDRERTADPLAALLGANLRVRLLLVQGKPVRIGGAAPAPA